MKRFITVIGLGLGLVVSSVGVAAQEPDGAIINADGSSGTSSSGVNPAVDADGPTIVYGDLNPGPGMTVIGPPPESAAPVTIPGTTGDISAADGNASALGPGEATAAPGTVTSGSPGTSLLGPDGTYSVTDTPPSNVSVGDEGALAPAPEAAPVTTETAAPVEPAPVEPVPADTTAAASGDLDGDNYPDALELEIGLDPNNVDTDADGVADGDELNIYGTDPWTFDSDGDGLSDGAELFDTRTDPLVWQDSSGGAADGGGQTVAATEPLFAEETASAAPAGDSDGDRLPDADEAAVGTDPSNPDTDGDGYYDGDEIALGTSPFDPAAFPAT